jgi:hypothetical protein
MKRMQSSRETPTESLAERVRGEHSEQEHANRRHDKRFAVPGSRVRVPCRPFQVAGAEIDTRELLFGLVPALWSQRREVVNLSKGGLAFESRWPVGRGRKLRMQLWVPGFEQPLEVTGETRWCKPLLGRLYHVGVQFDAFGSHPGMNPPAVLAALRQLEATHA